MTRFSDRVGETPVEITFDPQTNQLEGTTTDDGQPVVFQSHWWFGWKEFHPDTEIWSGEAIEP